MYDCNKYKNFAKKQLNKRWSVPILMTLFVAVIMLLFEVPGLIKSLRSEEYATLLATQFDNFQEMYIAVNDFSASIPKSNVSSIIQLIIEGILTYASISVYLKMSRSPEKISFTDFIEGLNSWAKAALGTLWEMLWVFLWSMLFVIPGLIKYISYSQMKYILMEYENVSVTKAMRISMIITNGHKMDLFLTLLSFIGWWILCILTAGIGFIFLNPYMEMTMVNAYHALMKEALETGKILPEDLE